MTDQCKHCTVRGDLRACLAVECFQHESWYAIEQQKRIDKLTAALEEFKKQYSLSPWIIKQVDDAIEPFNP